MTIGDPEVFSHPISTPRGWLVVVIMVVVAHERPRHFFEGPSFSGIQRTTKVANVEKMPQQTCTGWRWL
jgi:hypothetical protein